MPQYTEPPANMTPFAQVLVDFMWNKRPRNSPPLSYAQLAIRLGVPKQSVSNWILRGSVPPLDTIMVILLRLRIPLRDLYDAYAQSDLPTPAWDDEEQARFNADLGDSPSAEEPTTPRIRKPAKAPLSSTAASSATSTPAPEPLPYTPPPPAPSQAEEWDRIIANTEQTLRQEGVSEAAIAAVLADLRSRQSGEQTPIQRSLIAEHSETTETSDPEPVHNEPSGSPPSDRAAKRGGATKGSLR